MLSFVTTQSGTEYQIGAELDGKVSHLTKGMVIIESYLEKEGVSILHLRDLCVSVSLCCG